MTVWLCKYCGEFLIATTRNLLLDAIFDRGWIRAYDIDWINQDSFDFSPTTLYNNYGEDWKNTIKNWTDSQIADNYNWDILIEEINVIGT